MPRSNKLVAQKPVAQNPVAVQHSPVNELPSLFSSMKQGFGFGVGSSIAHNIFDSKPAKPVLDKTTEFKQCMETTHNYEECAPILK